MPTGNGNTQIKKDISATQSGNSIVMTQQANGQMTQQQDSFVQLEDTQQMGIMHEYSEGIKQRLEKNQGIISDYDNTNAKFRRIHWIKAAKMKSAKENAENENSELDKRKNAFFAPCKLWSDDMAEQLNSLKDAGVENITKAFVECINSEKTVNDEKVNIKNVNTEKLVKNVDLSDEVKSLGEMFTGLSKMNTDDFTLEKAKEYIERYKELESKLTIRIPAARHLDTAKEVDAKASYVMLYHCVANMLQYQLNNVDHTKVNATEFSKLYALSQASAISANALVINADYQNKIKERDKRLLVEARQKYLRESAGTIAQYAGIAEKLLGDKIFTLSDAEFEAEVAKMEKNIEDNTRTIEEHCKEQVKEMPMLEMVMTDVVSGIFYRLGGNALEKVINQNEIGGIFDNYLKEKGPDIYLCRNEIRAITEDLALLPKNAESTKITKAFTKHAGEMNIITKKELFEGEIPAGFEELEKLYSELSEKTAEEFTKEEAKKFGELYRKLSGAPNAERVDEAGAMDPDSCYILIYNGVLNMLYNKIKENGTSVNEDGLLKLYAKLKLSENAVSLLLLNNNYKNNRYKNVTKLLVAARQKYLRESARTIAPYAEAAEKIFGKKIFTLSDAEFEAEVAKMEKNIEDNTKAIEEYCKKQAEEMPMLEMIMTDVVSGIFNRMGGNALKKVVNSSSDEMRKCFEGYAKQEVPSIALCMREIEAITKNLDSLPKDAEVALITKTFTKHAGKVNKISEKALFKGTATNEEKKLEKIYSELSKTKAEEFTKEEAKKFGELYRKLSGAPNAERVDEAGAMDPNSCYILIYNGVLNMLYDKIKDKGASVDENELLKLYTKFRLSETVVKSLLGNEVYKNKREENIQKVANAIMHEKEMRQQEAITEARRKYLREGISGSGKAEEWPIGPYAEAVEKILGDKIFSLSDEAFAREVARMEESLEKNTVAVKIYCRKQIQKNTRLLGLKDSITEMMLSELEEKLLTERDGISDDVMREAFGKVVTQADEKSIKKYDDRMAVFMNNASLKLLSDALNSAEIANMIYNLEDEEFKSAAERIAKQAEKNIEIAKKLIAEKITGKNRDDALGALIARKGRTLLSGAPSVVYMETEYFLDYLRQFAPEVARYEDSLRLKIKKNGIDDSLNDVVLRQLSKQAEAAQLSDKQKEEVFINNKLSETKKLIDENIRYFDEKVSNLKLNDDDWAKLFTWQKENIMLSEDKTDPRGFAKKLEKELSGLKGNLSRKEYERKKNSDTSDAIGKVDTPNIDFIRGEGLCNRGDFNGALAGKADAVMAALDKALKNNVFKEDFKNTKQLSDIESLSYTELDSMIAMLRLNMARAIEQWSNIQGGNHSEEVKSILLYELICGTLTKDNIEERVKAIEVDIESKINVGKIRLQTLLAGDVPTETSQVGYLHLSETAFTGIIGEVSRPVRRNLRFATANDIWKKIEDAKLTDLMQEYWSERVSDYNYPVHKIIEKIGDKIRDLGKDVSNLDNEMSKLNKEISRLNKSGGDTKKQKDDLKEKQKEQNGKKDSQDKLKALQNILKELPENCENEFMFRGMQDEFLSYTDIGKVFTSGDNNVYNKALESHIGILIKRYMDVEAALGNMDKDEKDNYHAKIKKLIAGIEPVGAANPTDEQKILNREKFGVSDWNEALDEIKEFVSQQDNSEAKKLVGKLKEVTEKLEGNEKLKPFVDVILQDRKSYGVLMTADDAESCLNELKNLLEEPYEALKTYNINGQFAKEFIIEHAKELLVKVNDPKKHWTKKVEGYFNTFFEHKVGKVSFRTRYEELSKNEILKPYLAQIVLYDDVGVSMLLNMDKEKGKEKIREFEERIIANENEFEKFLQENTELKDLTAPKDNGALGEKKKLEHPLIKGFKLYVHNKISSVKATEFKTDLGKYLEDFKKLDVKNEKNTENAKEEMERREKERQAIEGKKKLGLKMDSEKREILEEMREKQRKYVSPIMFAHKCEKKPSKSDVLETRKAVDEKFENIPNIVREILVESSLAGAKSKQLEADKEALMKAYNVIKDAEFKISDDVKLRLNDAEAYELLTVLFVNGGLNKSAGEMAETLKVILECHDKIRELAKIKIDDAGLLAERDSLIDTLSAGMYTTGKDVFDKIAKNRISYIKASAEALKIFHKEIKNYIEKDKKENKEKAEEYKNQEAILCAGLREYFHENLLRGSLSANSLKNIEKETKALLDSDSKRQFLKYSTTPMQGIDSKDEIKTTSSIHTVAQKKNFEEKLYDLKEKLYDLEAKKAIKSYMKMDVARQQIFAMALAAPGQDEVVLGSAKLQITEKRDEALRIKMREYIHKYISHEEFTPAVDYARALDRLQKPDGTFDKKAFERAEKFTEAVYKEYQKNMPVDFDRLSDGMSSLLAANRLLQKKVDDEKLNVENYKDFLDKLKNEDEGEAEKVKKKLGNLSRHQLSLLVSVLQDRTVLDRSTKITALDRAKGTEHEYVNSEKREELKGMLIKEDSGALENMLSSAALSNAMTSLLSYQLRDDVKLSKGTLSKRDFAKKALERKTVIDWDLLSEALLFVHEIEKETHRLNAVKQADSVILVSGNEAAIAKYKECQNHPVAERKVFEAYLLEQAKEDNMPALYAGYSQLGEAEKNLFIKVLGQRHLLDISKVDIGLNRLGLAERDFVDPDGRSELIDEFIENALGELDNKSYQRAVDMTLSTQINDNIDFTLKKDKSLEEFLTSQSNPFKNVRKTAVDWKLVGRALQFVHRAVNEKDIFRQDRELYVSQGNLLQNGRFSFDNEHLRKNIHNSGWRVGRYFFGRVKENLSDQIPSYLQPVLSGAMFAARMTLSAKNADKITKLGIIDDVNFDISENFSDFFSGGEFINETSSGLFEKGNDFYGDYLAETVKRKAGEEKYKIAEGKLETAGEHIGYTNTAIEALMAGGKLGYLAHAKGKSNKAMAEDRKKTVEAEAHQTVEQQELSEKAIKRNFDLQYQGRSYAVNRQVDTIINGVASVIGSVVVENDYLAMAVAEAGEFINFVRSYIQDRKSIVKFFKKNGELEKMRKTYNDLQWDKKEELDDNELIRKMKGYENDTELSSFVGIDITRSLLFSASKYNPQDHLSILAIATLVAVGQKDAIGKQDAETAQAVFDAIMGSDYR